MKDGTTILFGLPEVAVERVDRVSDGARTVHVVTVAETAAAYPACGVVLDVGEAVSDDPAEATARSRFAVVAV